MHRLHADVANRFAPLRRDPSRQHEPLLFELDVQCRALPHQVCPLQVEKLRRAEQQRQGAGVHTRQLVVARGVGQRRHLSRAADDLYPDVRDGSSRRGC